MSTKLKVHSIDSGFCRVYYHARNNDGESVWYCLQDEGKNIGLRFYRCTDDGEPCYPIELKKPASELLEIPAGDSEIEKQCAAWIANN